MADQTVMVQIKDLEETIKAMKELARQAYNEGIKDVIDNRGLNSNFVEHELTKKLQEFTCKIELIAIKNFINNAKIIETTETFETRITEKVKIEVEVSEELLKRIMNAK